MPLGELDAGQNAIGKIMTLPKTCVECVELLPRIYYLNLEKKVFMHGLLAAIGMPLLFIVVMSLM